MRRVAIAGILARSPRCWFWMNPAAGLDPQGRKEILDNVKCLHETGMTVILVSHNMDDVARLCQRIMVLHRGKLVTDGSPRNVFSQGRFLESLGLKSPDVTVLMERLKDRGWNVREDVLTVEEAYSEIIKELRGRGWRESYDFERSNNRQYYPADSLVHSLDPRAKILISIMFMIVLFVGNNFYSFFVTGIFALLSVILSKIRGSAS